MEAYNLTTHIVHGHLSDERQHMNEINLKDMGAQIQVNVTRS